MALDTVDHAIRIFHLDPPRPDCRTEHLAILGSAEYDEQGDQKLAGKYAFDPDVAAYLNRTYGDQAEKVAELAVDGYARRLVDGHPVIVAEVLFAARYELAERVIDVLARRMPLALLDTSAARTAVDRVLELMAEELGWTAERCEEERKLAGQRLTEAL